MAKGSIKVGDEVVITATVRKRVTEDRVSVLIPTYNQPRYHCQSGRCAEALMNGHPTTR
ncbi:MULTISPECIES: hypothetical protein [unclassified Mesorhizobium]|uniref:hypothetical protein n=1 Tax=unclassified Mesorhizobium TaxID=325217 RepID=UPI00167B20ED|nr:MULTISPECIES: hypothetical protein [unclassified Mesorhizobium]